jgi:hypothetical protein
MDANSQQQNAQDGVLSALNAAIESLNRAKEASCVRSVKAVFGSVSALLTVIRVSFLPTHLCRLLANMNRIRWPKEQILSS